MWGTLSFIKTLNSVRQMGARLLCVCYISMRCIEGREDSVTERPVPAPTSAHAGESPAQLRHSPLTALASRKHRPGQEQAFLSPPRPRSQLETQPRCGRKAAVTLARNTEQGSEKVRCSRSSICLQFLWLGWGSFGLTRTHSTGARLSCALQLLLYRSETELQEVLCRGALSMSRILAFTSEILAPEESLPFHWAR